MQLKYAKNPVWANAEHTCIDLTVKWVEIDEELPFTASPSDCEAHGRAVFAAAQSGDYGEIAEFMPYVPTLEEKSAIIREQRDQKLFSTDWTQAFDVPQATKDKWAIYRQALRDIPQQEGFPWAVVWPTQPV
jgi:predicted metal-binding protein